MGFLFVLFQVKVTATRLLEGRNCREEFAMAMVWVGLGWVALSGLGFGCYCDHLTSSRDTGQGFFVFGPHHRPLLDLVSQ